MSAQISCREAIECVLTIVDNLEISPKSVDVIEVSTRTLARCTVRSLADLQAIAAALKVKKLEATDRRHASHIEFLIAVDRGDYHLVVQRHTFLHESDWDDAVAHVRGAS